MIRALIGTVTLASIIATAVAAPTALAQEQSSIIQATGTGSASAPPATVQLQFLISAGNALGMDSVAIEATVPDVETGTPVAAMPSAMAMNPAPLSEEQLTPIVDAIGNAGIQPDAIVVNAPVYNGIYGPGGPESAEIRISIDLPQHDALVDLVDTVTTAANANGLSVLYVGATYGIADCAALTQQAREAAIADANERAAGLAQGLGVTLGTLLQASETPYFGGLGSDSCAAAGTGLDIGSYGPGTEPAFDPNAIETTVFVQVTLTYAFATAG